jgi:hypothetical protein
MHPNYGVDVADLDLAELALCFKEANLTRYLSWEQTPMGHGDFALVAKAKTSLIDEPPEPFPEIQAEQDLLLSQFIGRTHTKVELFLNEYEELMAAAFYFDSACFIAAAGFERWDDVKQEARFEGFGGNDLFLWTQEQFIKVMKTSSHQLIKCAKRLCLDAT